MLDFAAIQALTKALEAGNYGAAPGSLSQGAALQGEDLSPVITNVCFEDKHIKLQKMISSQAAASTSYQFNRQLSYGQLGGSAQLEGNVGQEETSDIVRVVVPMCFYSHYRRVTLAAMQVETVDGQKADDRAAADAAKKVAGDMELDLFRGRSDFSNAGVFDGHPLARSEIMPNIIGLDEQVRESDILRNARDLMFAEYGSDDSVVLVGGGALTQDMIEDMALRATNNFSEASDALFSPNSLAAYNKLGFAKERIVLSGSAQGSTGSELRVQHTASGTVKLDSSQWLRGKTSPMAVVRPKAPVAPAIAAASAAISGVTTAFVAAQVYQYFVTSGNEAGESAASASASVTIATTGHGVNLTITHPGSGTSRWFNVYRSVAGGTAASAKFIGRIKLASGGSTVFKDLGNKRPGFSTGFLIDASTMEIRDLMPFTRVKLAQTDLSMPEAYARFSTLAVMAPRKNVLLDNLL